MKNIRSNAFSSSSKYICIFSTNKKSKYVCVYIFFSIKLEICNYFLNGKYEDVCNDVMTHGIFSNLFAFL